MNEIDRACDATEAELLAHAERAENHAAELAESRDNFKAIAKEAEERIPPCPDDICGSRECGSCVAADKPCADYQKAEKERDEKLDRICYAAGRTAYSQLLLEKQTAVSELDALKAASADVLADLSVERRLVEELAAELERWKAAAKEAVADCRRFRALEGEADADKG